MWKNKNLNEYLFYCSYPNVPKFLIPKGEPNRTSYNIFSRRDVDKVLLNGFALDKDEYTVQNGYLYLNKPIRRVDSLLVIHAEPKAINNGE
jgi:hypothetical protein